MSASLTEACLQWASQFCRVDAGPPSAASAAAKPKADPGWKGRPMHKVQSAQEMDDDLDRYASGEPPSAPVSMKLDETEINFEPEDMSTHSKDRDIRASAAKVHKMAQDNAPMIADQVRHEAAAKAEMDKQKYTEKVDALSNAVKANCALMCGAVSGACSDFQVYAARKIEKLKEKRSKVSGAADLFVGLVTVVADLTGTGIVAKVTSELGKKVADAIKGAIKDKIVDATKDAVKGDANLDALNDAIGNLAHAARLNAEDTTKRAFGAINDLLAEVKSGAPDRLSPQAAEFITPFLDATPAQADSYLESYGVPNASTCTSIRISVYKGLVREFETKMIVEDWKDEYGSDVIDDEMTKDKAFFDKKLASAAASRADQAAKEVDAPPAPREE
jgi:hypothetical protein